MKLTISQLSRKLWVVYATVKRYIIKYKIKTLHSEYMWSKKILIPQEGIDRLKVLIPNSITNENIKR